MSMFERQPFSNLWEHMSQPSFIYFMDGKWPVFTSLCLGFVGVCALAAIIKNIFRDTVLERICIAGISMGCMSRAWYVYHVNDVPADFVWLAAFLALYCIALIIKHVWVIPNRPDYKPPDQMPRY